MTDHEVVGADLHGRLQQQAHSDRRMSDMAGGPLEQNSLDNKMQEKITDRHDSDSASTDSPRQDGDEPSAEERATLRRIGDSMPLATWLVAIVELCERFTYYGCQGLFQNYIARDYGGNLGRGALGRGNKAATGINIFFQFFCYVTPILGAVIADQYTGRYKAIVIFSGVYLVGLLLLWTTALPTSLESGAGFGGFITAIIVIGFGTGGIKSNVAPLIADQYQRRTMALKTLASGERVIIDPAVTMQRIYMVFYWCINVGALSLLATPYMEQDIGYWSAYLLCFCMFGFGTTVLVVARKKYVVRPPQGDIITSAFKVIGQMIMGRNRDAPKPSYKVAHGKSIKPSHKWDDKFVEEVKRSLIACQVFIFYPVFWVAYGQFSSNFVTQAGQMQQHGIPNDLMQNFDPIAIIVFIPILDRLVYPFLRKFGIKMRPVTRITIGFFIAGLGMAYAAVLQYFIYQQAPCYDAPLECPASRDPNNPDAEYEPNHIHIAIQTPAYMLIGVSEIFISVTGLEYAYTKAPASMKSFVNSMYLLTFAVGAALSETLVSTAENPKFLWLYTGIACASVITSIIFWFTFKHLNAEEEALNEMDKDEPFRGRDEAGDTAVESQGNRDQK